jgi:hypothetical protein
MKKKNIFLEDLKDYTEEEIKLHLATQYADEHTHEYNKPDITMLKELKQYSILIAYESVGSWGCDSASYYLLRHKKTKELFEIHGSHCSCYGFEGQGKLEPTTTKYLKSDKFNFYVGGYDSDETANQKAVYEYIKSMRK